jgi:hypothetical protein
VHFFNELIWSPCSKMFSCSLNDKIFAIFFSSDLKTNCCAANSSVYNLIVPFMIKKLFFTKWWNGIIGSVRPWKLESKATKKFFFPHRMTWLTWSRAQDKEWVMCNFRWKKSQRIKSGQKWSDARVIRRTNVVKFLWRIQLKQSST